MNRYLELFWSFFKIGLFTFGGGYAMIPIIQNEVIRNRGWIEERDFLDLLTLAQSAPGPISLNTSVFVGYKLYGYRQQDLGENLPQLYTSVIFRPWKQLKKYVRCSTEKPHKYGKKT